MPRRLEIRTTILEKKPSSSSRAKEKDANANDVYADEALQLLEEIEQLKSNVSVINGFLAPMSVDFNETLVSDSLTGQQVACSTLSFENWLIISFLL